MRILLPDAVVHFTESTKVTRGDVMFDNPRNTNALKLGAEIVGFRRAVHLPAFVSSHTS